MNDALNRGALSGVRVIDLTRVLAGPLATMMLGDMGADVIKVEEPGSGDLYRSSSTIDINGESVNFLSTNRNKRSLTLALDTEEGRNILLRLAGEADVLVENFRPGAMQRLGLDYQRLREVNPRLVYCSVTGFGPDGPYGLRTAVDPIIQAESGIMSLTGEKDGGPVRVGSAVGDIYGAMLAAQGILLALLARHQTGEGQLVELSLFDSAVFGLIPREGEYFATGQVFPRWGSAHPQFVPFQAFATADGHVFVAAFHDALWKKLCVALGVPRMAEDERFAGGVARSRNRDALLAGIEPIFATRSSAQWVDALQAAGIPAGRINDLADVFRHPQLQHNGMVVEMQHPVAGPIRLLNHPVKLSDSPSSMRRPPPMLGEHSAEVLAGLGYDESGIARLRRDGVI